MLANTISSSPNTTAPSDSPPYTKAWIPDKDVEKLKKVIGQEKNRVKFVGNLFSIRME